MPYFNNFRNIAYSLNDSTGEYNIVTDIFQRVVIRDAIKKNASFLNDYFVQEGDTPEIIADKVYGDAELHWVVLLMNDILNPIFDFALSQRKFELFAKDKYPGVSIFMKDPAELGLYTVSTTGLYAMTTTELYLSTVNGANDPSGFMIGDEITLSSIGGVTATIWNWNRTLRKLDVYRPNEDAEVLHSELVIVPGETVVEEIFILGDPALDSTGFVFEDTSGFQLGGTEGSTLLSQIADVRVLHIEALHHFEDSTGIVLDPLDSSGQYLTAYINSLKSEQVQPPASLVTNYEYEEEVNDNKKKIKLLKPEYVGIAINELRSLLNK